MKHVPLFAVQVADITQGCRDLRVADAALWCINHPLGLLDNDIRLRGMVISSAWRSWAKQAALYARWRAGRGPRAAPPGRSWHHWLPHPDGGLKTAVDIKIPGKDPHGYLPIVLEIFRRHGQRWHTIATERKPGGKWADGWLHVQIHYGGGEAGNPGLVAHW